MKPYRNIKLEQWPDVDDIRRQGRKSSVGRFAKKSGDYYPYVKGSIKKRIRRNLKQRDKQMTMRGE